MAFKTFDRKEVAFSVGGFKAGCEFRTESSISFDLWTDGTLGDSMGKGFGSGQALLKLKSYPVRMMKGHVDVHYPCQDHVKLRIRVILPKSNIDAFDHPTKMSFLKAIVAALELPDEETYEILFVGSEDGLIIGHYTDRNGVTDRV